MDFAAKHSASPPDSAQHAAARRFGLALITSAAGVAVVAFGLFELSQRGATPAQPLSRKQSAGVLADTKAVAAPSEVRYDNLLAAFAQALERDDDAALRAIYPTMSERDARVLHSLRRRLGASTLSVDALRLRSATPQEVHVEFVITASSSTVRLPFAAALGRQQSGNWVIQELH